MTYLRIHSTGQDNCRLTGQVNCRLTVGRQNQVVMEALCAMKKQLASNKAAQLGRFQALFSSDVMF